MKKGDMKRSSILKAAETLFFEKGYEQTSVQDILDALSLSKGGFYHYFPSKDAILEEICENRVLDRFNRLSVELSSVRISPMDRLNLLLRLVNLFDRDEPKFAALMLKICYLDGDVRIRDQLHDRVIERLRSYVDDAIQAGVDSGDFYVRHPGWIGRIVLSMASDADDAACRMLATNADNPECVIDIAELLTACRDAIETLLGAPFGSILLFDPEKLVTDHRVAAAELLKLEGDL